MIKILEINQLITGIIFVIFGIIILFQAKDKKIKYTLAGMIFTTAGWEFCYAKWIPLTNNHDQSLFWIRVLSIFSTLIPIFYYHWVLVLLKLDKQYKKSIIFFYIVGGIMELFVFHPWYIRDVVPTAGYLFWPKAGWLYTLYIIFVYSGLIIYSVFLLFKDFFNSKGIRRERDRYVILGTIIGFGGGATNFFLWFGNNIWDNFSWLPLGSILVVVYPIMFTYSIIKHNLMDIKLVLRSSTVYIAEAGTIIFIVILLNKLFLFLHFETTFIMPIIVTILLLYSGKIQKFYFKLANKYFFSSLYDSREFINDLSDKLGSTLDLEKVYALLFTIFTKYFHPNAFAIYRIDDDNKINNYIVNFYKGFSNEKVNNIALDKYILKNYLYQNIPIIVEEIENKKLPEESQKIINQLKQNDIELISPLNVKDKTIGLLVFSGKKSKDMYNKEDIEVLKVLNSQIALAMENAILFYDINEKNKRLNELLYMKSDFLRVVSHQLNTPISVMRYALSSVEENYLPLKESMNFAKKGLERISSTIDDFIYAYQLEGKTMTMNIGKVDIFTIVKNVAEEKKDLVKAQYKKIDIKIIKKEDNIPEVLCDKNKISQVISIILSNSVFYTKEGTITIKFENKDNKFLKILFTDTGIGIKDDEKKNLFKKFIRSENAQLMQPDGSGLGLYIAKKILKGNNGELRLEETKVGLGSTFSLQLPIAK